MNVQNFDDKTVDRVDHISSKNSVGIYWRWSALTFRGPLLPRAVTCSYSALLPRVVFMRFAW